MKSVPFNSVAADLTAKERKAVMEAIWGHAAATYRAADTNDEVNIVADILPGGGETLFCVSFPGAKRDRIPTQHYMVGGIDGRDAVTKAHHLYVLEPRHRKGASLRVMVTPPPADSVN